MMKGYVSSCGKFRYSLYRTWSDGPFVTFVTLHPTLAADDFYDDRNSEHIRRIARNNGFGGMKVVSLFALICDNEADLVTASDPVGPLNHRVIFNAISESLTLDSPIVAAWGSNLCTLQPAQKLFSGIPMMCLGRCDNLVSPKQPLTVPENQTLMEYFV